MRVFSLRRLFFIAALEKSTCVLMTFLLLQQEAYSLLTAQQVLIEMSYNWGQGL
jgi:hypothetical protein